MSEKAETGSAIHTANVLRLQSIVHTIQAKKVELESVPIVGSWRDDFKKVLAGLLDALSDDTATILQVMGGTIPVLQAVQSEVDRLYDQINFILDDLLHLLDTLLSTNNKHVPIHEYISYTLRDLKLAEDIRYYVCLSETLATIPLIKHWTQVFSSVVFFSETRRFLAEYAEKNRDFFVFMIPALIMQKKEYWPALIHEVGHIVTEHFGVIERYYEPVPEALLTTPEGIDYYHSREFASDYVANIYSGPVFFDIHYQLLYKSVITLGKTHPSWEARLYFLQDKCRGTNNGRVVVNREPKESHTTIAKLEDILKEIGVSLDDNFFYNENKDESDRALRCLEEGVPYMGPPRILLNAYWANKSKVLENIIKNGKTATSEKSIMSAENDVGLLIEDSIRLSNMKRTYDLMACPPME